MAQLPIDEAITRFKENEDRFDTFVNIDGTYTTNEGTPRTVQTLPSFMEEMVDTYLAYSVKGNWTTATAYAVQDLVKESGTTYICLVAHTSGTFATDLSAGKWGVYQGVTVDDLASSASGKGAEMIEYQGSTVEVALGGRLPEIGTYALLRAYTGPVTAFLVRGVANIFDGGAGVFRVDASDTTTADNGGTVLVDASGRRWKRDFSGEINVKWFGARGDMVTDDTAAIDSAVAFAAISTSVTSVVFFPDGIYRRTAPLLIDRSGLEIRGNSSYGALSYSPVGVSGSHIIYDANDGGDIIVFGSSSNYRYRNTIANIRVGAAPGVTTKPGAAVRFNACSEASVINLNVNGGCTAGLVLNSCTLTYVDVFYGSLNDAGIVLETTSAVPGASANVANWFRNLNIYNCDDGVLFIGSARNINFRDSWVEYSERAFHFRQDAASIMEAADIQLDNVYGSVGASGPADSRFIKATPLAGASQYLRVGVKARNCTAYNYGATYNVEFVKGTNSGANTYLDQAVFDNCTFFGASTAVVTSDTANSSASFTGHTIAVNAFGTGSVIPLVAGNARLHKLATENGYWDMVGSYPIRLPTIDALSYATNGQFYFQSTRYRLAYTANGNRILLPRPLMQTYADEDVTVNVTDSAETLRFNSPLTADRAVTLSATNAYNGAKFRIVRTAAATGAFSLNVGGGLKLLAVAQWCDVEHDGAAWRLTASGTL